MGHSLQDFLVVCDMDNTLLTAEKGIPSCNLETVKLFCALGGRFTVASRRTADSVGKYLDKLPLTAPAITYGGGVLYDFSRKKVISAKTLPKVAAHRALEDIRARFPSVGIEIMADNGRIYLIRANEYTHRHTLYEKLRYVVSDYADVPGEWNKVLFAAEPAVISDIADYMRFREYPGVYFVATNTVYYEIMPENVTKASGLRELCRRLSIPIENTIAIGDYYNDIDIMKAAGYSVAVANAPPEVQAEADEVTGACLDGGVAQYLYRLITKYS